MTRLHAILLAALALTAVSTPAVADSQMKQSPLLMRRAGPSCQPGNLGGEEGAGYFYRLGPCAGADASTPPRTDEGQDVPRRRRRF